MSEQKSAARVKADEQFQKIQSDARDRETADAICETPAGAQDMKTTRLRTQRLERDAAKQTR